MKGEGKVKIVYASKKMEQQCTDLKTAKKPFSGDKSLAMSLLSRVNALIQAESKDCGGE